jgi:hypothetical protein
MHLIRNSDCARAQLRSSTNNYIDDPVVDDDLPFYDSDGENEENEKDTTIPASLPVIQYADSHSDSESDETVNNCREYLDSSEIAIRENEDESLLSTINIDQSILTKRNEHILSKHGQIPLCNVTRTSIELLHLL